MEAPRKAEIVSFHNRLTACLGAFPPSVFSGEFSRFVE
jgi:hypothetical protein